MNTPTFKEQFDKITRAYFNGELVPMDQCACFIGNMLNNTSEWGSMREPVLRMWGPANNMDSGPGFQPVNNDRFDPEYGFYTMEEICNLENNFLHHIWGTIGNGEDCLYRGMDTTLDMLRKIHEAKGQVIDEHPAFKKRELQPA